MLASPLPTTSHSLGAFPSLEFSHATAFTTGGPHGAAVAGDTSPGAVTDRMRGATSLGAVTARALGATSPGAVTARTIRHARTLRKLRIRPYGRRRRLGIVRCDERGGGPR